MKKLIKGKGLLGVLLTALLLCALVVPAAMLTPALAAEGEWTEMTSPTRENLYGVWGSSSSDVFAVGDKGTILHYAPPSYTLTTAVDPVGSGTVELNPAGPTYPAGTKVTLTANPAEGFTFDHWSGDLEGSANPASITMDADKNVTAYFVKAAPQPDVNGDGRVNVEDMISIGQKWDETGGLKRT